MRWTVIDLDPEKPAAQAAADLALHFTQVTNENEALFLFDGSIGRATSPISLIFR